MGALLQESRPACKVLFAGHGCLNVGADPVKALHAVSRFEFEKILIVSSPDPAQITGREIRDLLLFSLNPTVKLRKQTIIDLWEQVVFFMEIEIQEPIRQGDAHTAGKISLFSVTIKVLAGRWLESGVLILCKEVLVENPEADKRQQRKYPVNKSYIQNYGYCDVE